MLRGIDALLCLLTIITIPGAHCTAFGAACLHQFVHQPLPLTLRQQRVGTAPQTATHHEVASVGRDGRSSVCWHAESDAEQLPGD